MTNITYLLGAGASYQSLPIVTEMANKIGITRNWLEKQYKDHSITNRFSTADGKRFYDVLSDLDWLKDICDTSKNFSVDTYARKLGISEKHDEYVKLKNILAFYFTIEQRRNPPDTRYDNFWASILKSKLEFPSNLKIISWNYDFQLELTYLGFLGGDSLNMSRRTLNISSLETKSFRPDKDNCFEVFKLNGSATFSSKAVGKTNYWIDNFNGTAIDEFIISLVGTYEKICDIDRDINNHLSFAWEHQTNNEFYNHLKQTVFDTEVLVVIGYSFPFFNRDIDKMVFNDFMGDKLRKVYFQAPDAEDLRERFLAINDRIHPDNLVLRKDVKQFTLPNEL
jgi:hypothetical protein